MVSSLKTSNFRLKMVTRKSLVAKKRSFLPKNDDEKWSRRQKKGFLGSKRRREMVSSPKKGVSRLKMTTRNGLVAKKRSFPRKNDDEKWPRRQKKEFPAQKRRREMASSPKNAISRLKMVTRFRLVVKNRNFPPKNYCSAN